MTTASEIIITAHLDIGAHDPNQTLSAVKMAGGLEKLNDMLAQWSSEGMLIYATTQENFPLTSAQSYTIGTGGTFNTTVPIEIVSAFTRVSGQDYPCEIVTIDDYNTLTDKSSDGSWPDFLSFRRSGTLGTIYTYPVSTGTLYLENRKLLQQFATSATVYTLPAEALHAIKTNLAILLAPRYGKSVDPNLGNQAVTSKNTLKSLYVTTPKARFDFNGSYSGNLSILDG